MSTSQLEIKKYNQEGDMAHEYNPLHNLLEEDDTISNFTTDELDIDLNNPVNIECQPSYDGTVNLIINDDKNPPRIINSRFTTIEDNRYRIINRNQLQQTNLYKVGMVDRQTRLFRNINNIPTVDLYNIAYHGRLKGGNYTFYFKYADNDYNKTDIVAESGTVSLFKGTLMDVTSISGTLSDERTDKAVTLLLQNLDTSFSKIYVYWTRETSDLLGARITETKMLSKPYEIRNNFIYITINGYEEEEDINIEELNIKYNLVTAVKTQTQVQNMLFFANVQGVNLNIRDLQNISLYHKVALRQSDESLGWVDRNYVTKALDDVNQNEYYNPHHIYYKLGYWPGEIYRLGIVYIMNDDSLSPVFNLRGHKFQALDEYNYSDSSHYPTLFSENSDGELEMNYIPQNEFIDEDVYLDNTKGVFKNPDNIEIQKTASQSVCPLYYEVTLDAETQRVLKEDYNVKGYFLVRQKRIAITLAQGLSIGVDKISYTPQLYSNIDNAYISESFLNSSRVLTTDYSSRKMTNPYKQCSALISVDANVNPELQSTFDGSQFTLQKYKRATVGNFNRSYYLNDNSYQLIADTVISKNSLVYVGSDIPLKYVNDCGFSTRAGSPEEAKEFKFYGERDFSKSNWKLLRGIFCPIIGVTSNIEDNCIYNIRIQNYSSIFEKEYFQIRYNDNSSFYAISNRFEFERLSEDIEDRVHDIYRGDCYTATVTVRMHRNFTDSDVPVNELIVDPNTWSSNYNGYDSTDAEKWLDINRADLNTVPIGTWITFKILSNYNLGLRSEDRSNADEQAIIGNPRSFVPLISPSTSVGYKLEESWILNGGYSTTVGQKRNLLSPNVPYIKDLYDNRIMFSNVQVDDDFRNAYRVFQGLSYKDIDRQYGAIVKVIPWGVHLFCVFEHGLAIIPINEKALIQTATDQSVHMYGSDVIQNQLTLISPDFGSIWAESIIRTPVGIYGVDTYAKKVWRFSENNGLELISDMKIQRFLNDNVLLAEKDKYPTVALKNVKSHFNNYKGDVIFTFYNEDENTEWSMCYNERLDKWITRYSWIPLYSENINNIFYTLDKRRAEILAYIYDNQHTHVGINTSLNLWSKTNNEYSDFETNITIVGYDFYDEFEMEVLEVESSYIAEDGTEVTVNVPLEYVNINNSKLTINKAALTYLDESRLYYFKIRVKVRPKIVTPEIETYGSWFAQHIGVVLNVEELDSTGQAEYNDSLINGFYVHGRAGIFDEMDYFDNNPDNQIKPTKWYNKQEPFEFEFVVNNLTGFHKIFNDLVIISNNVEPKSLDFEIIGDVYDFNKAGIYKSLNFPEDNGTNDQEWRPSLNPKQTSQEFLNTEVTYDPILNQYNLVVHQPVYDIKTAGRLLGNIQYKEDSWYLEIRPILYKKKYKPEGQEPVTSDKETEVRIRDKFLKIRVKYSGEDLAVITALKTFMTLSHS